MANGSQESMTLRFARMVVRRRGIISFLLIVSTAFFFYPILNSAMIAAGMPLPGPAVKIDTIARSQWPDHPYIRAQDKFSQIFGGSSTVAVALEVKEGTIFNPETIKKIHYITQTLDGKGYDSQTDARDEMREILDEQGLEYEEINERLDELYPPYPVNHYQLSSVTANNTRVIQI